MYKRPQFRKTRINQNTSTEGETIETKIARLMTNGEPTDGQRELIYTERKDGVQAGFDIRTDRFEVALEATDLITKSYQARREEFHNPKVIKLDTEGEPTQGKDGGE